MSGNSESHESLFSTHCSTCGVTLMDDDSDCGQAGCNAEIDLARHRDWRHRALVAETRVEELTKADPTLACDGVADELLTALREHPANLLSAEMFALDGGRLQSTYNQLWDRVHGGAARKVAITRPSPEDLRHAVREICPVFGEARGTSTCEKCEGAILECPVYGPAERERRVEADHDAKKGTIDKALREASPCRHVNVGPGIYPRCLDCGAPIGGLA